MNSQHFSGGLTSERSTGSLKLKMKELQTRIDDAGVSADEARGVPRLDKDVDGNKGKGSTQ
jgi:hypothetical protein